MKRHHDCEVAWQNRRSKRLLMSIVDVHDFEVLVEAVLLESSTAVWSVGVLGENLVYSHECNSGALPSFIVERPKDRMKTVWCYSGSHGGVVALTKEFGVLGATAPGQRMLNCGDPSPDDWSNAIPVGFISRKDFLETLFTLRMLKLPLGFI